MVGGFRPVRHLGFDPKALELEKDRRKEERVRNYRATIIEGMIRYADEALANGDMFQFAELNVGLLGLIDSRLVTSETPKMMYEYLTGCGGMS